LIAALRVMTPAERARVDALFDNEKPGDAEVAEVIRIVTENGGLDYARQKGATFADEARGALAGLPDTVARQALFESISYVMERHA
jgi:geranylgeranyl pyrophosphate synthase